MTFALFAYGFRPFFWAAGAFALLVLVAWSGNVCNRCVPLPDLPRSSGTDTRWCTGS